jgi:acetyl esterase/lipase
MTECLGTFIEMMKFRIIICCTLFASHLFGQDSSEQEKYLAEQKIAGNSFASYFYPNYFRIYSLTEKKFISKIDSARNIFESLLQKYVEQLDPEFVSNQRLGIKYYFDKILLDYPNNHYTYIQTGKKTVLSKKLSKRLEENLRDFSNPELLSNSDLKEYVRSFFHHSINKQLLSPKYKNTDNQWLNAVWNLIPKIISDSICREFWQTEYLFNHIENNGIKNIETILRDFRAASNKKLSIEKIDKIYSEDSIGRQGHIIQPYKSVNGITLDLHLFLPDSSQYKSKHPVIVYFHGGSWSEGKPDWGFSSCEGYARNGWVGVAVEYRTVSRHNSLPFESVMDARSAIRWLRKNASLYNIDTTRIVATGNSAGGHLVLTTALAIKWNEKTDDVQISPTPNAMLINSGVYDLTIDNTKWITKTLKNKELVKEISPNHLEKKNMPPLLIVHGTNDGSCPYWTAEEFKDAIEKTNTNFEFHSLDGAGHFIWYDQRFTGQISKWRKDFLSKLGFE